MPLIECAPSSQDPGPPQYHTLGNGDRLAYQARAGHGPRVVFLSGFTSDMTGRKATHLDGWSRRRGQAFLRFDYAGHGLSDGRFEDGTIGRWADDAVAMLDACADGPLILVGSSMGGWLMLLAARQRPARIAGLVGIAAAPDFTEDLVWARLSAGQQAALMASGAHCEPSPYNEDGTIYTRRLIEEGRAHLVLRDSIALDMPVRLLHGSEDGDVPWQVSATLLERLAGDDVTLTLIKGGDHTLSNPAQLAALSATMNEICDLVA